MLARYSDKSGHKSKCTHDGKCPPVCSHTDTQWWLFTWKRDVGVSPLTFLSLDFFFGVCMMPLCCLPATHYAFLGQNAGEIGVPQNWLTFYMIGTFFIDALFFSYCLSNGVRWVGYFFSRGMFLFVRRLQGKLNANG